MAGPLQSLDYIYTPSRDVPRDLDYFEKVLGADVVFAIDGMGTRVAMIRFGEGAPLLLADHLKGRCANPGLPRRWIETCHRRAGGPRLEARPDDRIAFR